MTVPDDQHMRGGGSPSEVDDVGHPARLFVAANDADRFGRNRFLRLIGGGADVVRAVHVRHPDQGVREGAGGRGGFVRKDVEPDTQCLLPDRFGEGGVIDDLTAGGVDQHRTWLHPCQ